MDEISDNFYSSSKYSEVVNKYPLPLGEPKVQFSLISQHPALIQFIHLLTHRKFAMGKTSKVAK
jgi:hypothetical protein